ncbi:MAG: glucose-6-phosphate isomerase [Alphaproteobacteria bacterium]
MSTRPDARLSTPAGTPTRPPYRHVTENCFAEMIGDGGLTGETYRAVLAETAPAFEAIRAWHKDGSRPFVRLPERRDDLPAIEAAAARLRESFETVVVLGTGGSSLGGRTLTTVCQPTFGTVPRRARVRFVENVESRLLDDLVRGLDLKRTAFIVVSKSGRTVETLAQFLVCLAAMRRTIEPKRLGEHVLVITEPGTSPLRRLAEHERFEIIDHDPALGGRFSALSVVGLLPAVIAGLDATATREGAAAVLRETLAASEPGASAPAVGAAINVAMHRHKGIAQTVLMPYGDSLAPFSLWYRQLWAESLGKDGKGTTPINSIGTVDQHSQLQLYLAGPADKLYTFVTVDCAGTGMVIPSAEGLGGEIDWLTGRTMGDLMSASQRATWKTLVKRGRPVRLIRLPVLDARAMGAMMMHFMLETVVAAHLFGVEPFDQPAVEAGKVLARRYMERVTPRPS